MEQPAAGHPPDRRELWPVRASDGAIGPASNSHDPKGRDFDVYLMNLDGTGLERVTYNETFDGFPMFSPDGRSLVFASNRNAKKEGDTNVFIADWVD